MSQVCPSFRAHPQQSHPARKARSGVAIRSRQAGKKRIFDTSTPDTPKCAVNVIALTTCEQMSAEGGKMLNSDTKNKRKTSAGLIVRGRSTHSEILDLRKRNKLLKLEIGAVDVTVQQRIRDVKM